MTAATGIDLLTAALAAGPGLSARQLSDLGAAVEHDVAHVGVDALLPLVPPTEHVLFCTGLWPPATVRAQAAQAPMVRW